MYKENYWNKKSYIFKMTIKLEDFNIAPKSNWAILNQWWQFYFRLFCFNSTLIKNNSVLTLILQKTTTRISYFCVTSKDILSIIKSLDSSKSREYSNVSIKMIKISSDSVTIHLKNIF